MKTVFTAFDIANADDEDEVRAGRRADVRHGTGIGLVDPDALRLHLPRAVVVQLGLRVERGVFTRRRGDMVEKLDRAWGVKITLCGRPTTTSAVVEPTADAARIGRMVLTELDLIVDGDNNQVIPRDPNTIVTEVE